MGKDIERRKAVTILAEEINNKRLVIFIGAGCSISGGLPTWKDLINELLEKYHIKTLDTDLLQREIINGLR